MCESSTHCTEGCRNVHDKSRRSSVYMDDLSEQVNAKDRENSTSQLEFCTVFSFSVTEKLGYYTVGLKNGDWCAQNSEYSICTCIFEYIKKKGDRVFPCC